ncbi:MAG: hypothetical protein IKP96_03535 [Elusimicrobiaceae bacterium]|nr:hypothetical protein [Elusimicrobiaceae bacterium]
MKKILVVCAAALCVAACSNKTSNTRADAEGKTVYYTAEAANANQGKNAKYQIIDQEFDNMLAPDSDYDTLSDYELQACGSSYLPPAEKLKKPQVKKAAVSAAKSAAASTKVTKSKKVTNNTNIYYIDGPAPATPVRTSSTSTTTTYSSDGTVISTTTK